MTKKLFLCALAGLILFMNLEIFFMPVGTDEGMFYHIGQQISQGALPYRDVWEHKPPVAFYIFAAVLKISNTNAALIILGLFWTFFTAYLLYLLARQLLEEKYAQYAVFIFAFAANIHRFAQGGNQTEVYMVPFIILLYLFTLRFSTSRKSWHLFFAGLSLALGFQTKPVALFSGIAVGLYLLYDWYITRDSLVNVLKNFMIFGLGFALPNVMLVGYFAYKGILRDFINLNYGYNAMYVTRNNTSAMRGIWIRDTLLDNLISIPYLWVLCVTAFVTWRKQLVKPGWMLIYIAFFLDLAGVFLGGKFHGHYWIQLIPVLSLLAIPGYLSLPKNWIKYVVGALLVLALSFHLFSTGKQIYKKYVLRTPDTYKLVGYYVRARTTKTDRIYVNGVNPQVYFHANRPIVWNVETDNILNRLSAAQLHKYELLFKARKPKFIVITERPLFFAWQDPYIKKQYILDKKMYSCEIYRRK